MKPLWTMKELIEADFPEPAWIVDKIIPEGEMTLIIGRIKELKSLFTQYMSTRIICGQDVLGLKTKKAKILIIDEENSLAELRRRFRKIKYGLNDDEQKNLKLCSMVGLKFNDKDSLKKLKILIDKVKPEVIILDSLVRFSTGDENSAQDMKKVFDTTKELNKYNKKSLTWIILHHIRKTTGKIRADDARGSGDITAQPTCVLVVNRNDKITYTLSQEAVRNLAEPINDLQFKVYDKENDIIFELKGSSPKVYNVKEAAENAILPWICNQLIGTVFKTGLVKKSFQSHDKSALQDALKSLKDKGILGDEGLGKWKILKID